MSRHNVTVQFINRLSYDRLRVLAHVKGIPLGQVVSELVEKDISKRDIHLGRRLLFDSVKK